MARRKAQGAKAPKRKELGERQHAIMDVLWRRGEATVAEVHDALVGDERRALTTVATMLTKMEAKGVVSSRRDGRQLVYSPTVTRDEVRRSMVGALTDTLFGGRPSELVSHLIDEQGLSNADIEELKKLLESREGGGRDAR
ncbi:MAG: BlaI/MecI/CopY family transcriptional regulator [Planctomycetota bacterium]